MTDGFFNIISLAKKAEKQSGITFLHTLDEYLNLIQSDSFLSKALNLMQEYHKEELVELARKSSDANTNLRSIQDVVQDHIEEKYPLYSLRQMIRIDREFQYIKQYETEADIPDIELPIPDEDPYLKSSNERKVSLRRIPQRAALIGLHQHFKEFHQKFIKLIEQAREKGGLFSKYFDFDTETGTLYFKGNEIKMNERKKITNAHHLLAYLFTHNPFEQHFYKELEKDEVLLEPKSWSSYHRACEDIKNKVEKKTGIGDFLDFNSGSKMYVRINPKYSSG
jgi:hypothetical protein